VPPDAFVHCLARRDGDAGRAAGLWSAARSRRFRQWGFPAEFAEPGPEPVVLAANVRRTVEHEPCGAEPVAVVQPCPKVERPERGHDQSQSHAVEVRLTRSESVHEPEPVRKPKPVREPGSIRESLLQSSGDIGQPADSVCSFERAGAVGSFESFDESEPVVHDQPVAAVLSGAFAE